MLDGKRQEVILQFRSVMSKTKGKKNSHLYTLELETTV